MAAVNSKSAGAKFQQYQQATNQLLAIQQQQKQNVAQASTEEAVMKDKNTQLLQSSEFMAQQVAANNVLTQQAAAAVQQNASAAAVNPATAATLSQYGVGQPKQQKSTTTSTSKQQQDKQKVTINNKTENIIYNDIMIPAAAGAIGAAIKARSAPVVTDKSKLDGGLGKFKSWLGDTFNKQNEASAKRQREYRKKDAELTRSANKLTKNLSDITKNLGDRLDPKHMYRDAGLSFKNVLLLFGFAKIAKEWPELIEKLNNIETNIRGFFERRSKGFSNFFAPDGTLKKTLVRLLGGKENETVGEAFRALLFDEKEGLFPYIRKYLRDRLDERAAAIKTVEKPDFSLMNLGESIAGLGTYLSDILAAILSPKTAAGRSIRNIESQNREATAKKDLDHQLGDRRTAVVGYNAQGKPIEEKVYDNDRTLITREYDGLMRTALDSQGNLTNRASSYYSQSTDLRRNILDAQNGNINTASVGVGFERLYHAAQNHPRGKIPVSMDFVQNILDAREIQNLGLKRVQYTYVIRQRPAEEITGRRSPRYQYELVSPEDIRPDDFIANVGNNGPTLETPYVYEVTPEVLTKIIEKLTGKTGLEINVNNKEFMSAIEAGLMNRNKSGNINQQININELFAANDLYEQNRADEQEMWNNGRAVAAGQGISEVASEAGQNIRNRLQNMGQGIRNGFTNFTNSFGIGGGSLINAPDVDISGVTDYTAKGKASSGLFKDVSGVARQKKFIEIMRPAIKRKLMEKNLSPNYTDIVLAQMATESAWGGSEAGSFNYSGIKAPKKKDGTPSDENHAALLKTTERLSSRDPSRHKFPKVISIGTEPDSRGKYLWTVMDYFRTFDTLSDFLEYYINLLNNSTYRALSGTPSVDDYINRLTGGKIKYFTADPVKYKNGLLSRIETIYKLSGQELPEAPTNIPEAQIANAGTESVVTTPTPQVVSDNAGGNLATVSTPVSTPSPTPPPPSGNSGGSSYSPTYSPNPPSGTGPTPSGVEPDIESFGNMLPEVTVTPENYSMVSTPIATATPVPEEKVEEDRSMFIQPVVNFTEKLINIDDLLTLMVQTSGDNVEASMNVLDAIAARKAADSHPETPRQPMAPSYTAYNNPGSDPYLNDIFSRFGNLKSNTIG